VSIKPSQLPGVGIEHELVGIEPVSGVGFIWTMDPVAIDGAGAGRGQITVPNFVGIFGKLDPFELGFAGIIEQAELDLGGMARKKREVHAKSVRVAPSGNGLPSVIRVRRRLEATRVRASSECTDSFMVPRRKPVRKQVRSPPHQLRSVRRRLPKRSLRQAVLRPALAVRSPFAARPPC